VAGSVDFRTTKMAGWVDRGRFVDRACLPVIMSGDAVKLTGPGPRDVAALGPAGRIRHHGVAPDRGSDVCSDRRGAKCG
jgi:hypothetical protein